MGFKKVSNFLIGGYIEKSIYSKNKEVLIESNTFLDEHHIDLLKENGIDSIIVKIPELEKELFFQIERFIPKSSQPFFWESYLELLEDTKKLFFSIRHQQYSTPKRIIKKIHEMLTFLKDEKEFFEFTYGIEGYEDSLHRHSVNVAVLCFISAKLETSTEDPFELAKMGYFHDIGKLALDELTLNKKEKLTADEAEHIRQHPQLGAEIIRNLNLDSPEIQKAALLHHESRLGNGYPFGYSKEEIPFSVQMVTVADMFDAICSDRIYKAKKTIFQGFNELYFNTVDGRLNPLISFPFIENILSHYENQKILLNSGERGVLFHYNNSDIIRPVVELENGTFIDLSKNRDKFIIDIFKDKY